MHLGPRRAVAPDGTVWRVGRRWLPDLPRLRLRGRWGRRRRRDEGVDGPDLDGGDLGFGADDLFAASLAIGAVVLVIFVLTAWILPLLILVVEAVVVLLAAAAGLVTRLVSRRPWVVRARSDDGREQAWNVVGFKASGARRDAIARELEATGSVDRPMRRVGLEPTRPEDTGT